MRFLVREVSSEPEDYPQPTYLRLRTRYCVVFAIAVGCLIGAWGDHLASASIWLLDHAWDDYPWTLLPVIGLGIYLGIDTYLEFGKFFEPYSTLPGTIGVGGAVLGSPVVAAVWNGQLDVENRVGSLLPGEASAFAIGAVIVLASAAFIRRIDVDALSIDDPILFVGIGLLVLPGIYLVGRVLWTQVDWHSLVDQAADFLPRGWPVVLIPLLVIAQLPYWAGRARQKRMENHEGPSKSKPLHAAMLGLALFTGGLIAYAILYRFPEAIVSPEGLRPSAYENAITQERRTLLAILGSIGAAVGLVYTHLRHQLDRDANATGRYTEAVQQLGNESMSIRLGGIYALTRVARDSPGDSKTVTEVLAAFVRDGAQESTGGVALDVMAALTELGRISERSDESRYERVDLRSSRLVGGNLDSVRFPDRVDLRNSFLTGTNLRGASMSGADLTGATLDNAYLGQADLSGTDFSGSSVSQASFERATMRVCLLSELDLQGCNFEKSVLIGSDLSGSSLQRANLRGADLEGADLRNADLTDAVLVDAYVGGALFFGTGLTRETLRALGARDADEAVEEDPDVDERAMKKHEEWRRRNLRHDEMYPWEH